MNKIHIIFLTCMLSAPIAFGMDSDFPRINTPHQPQKKKRPNSSRTARSKRERETPKLDPADLNPRSWKNISLFEARTAAARLEASTNPDYGKWQADEWLKSLQARHEEVDPTVEAKIRDLAHRKEILTQSYPHSAQEYEDIIQEELCQFALENWLAVNTDTKRIKK